MPIIARLITAGLSQGLVHKEFLVKILITKVCTIIIPLLVWMSLFEFTRLTEYEGWGRLDFSGYYLIVLIITTITQVDFHKEFGALVREGRLTQWILRPVSFFEFSCGVILARMLLLAVPLAIAMTIFLATLPELLSNFEINFAGFFLVALGIFMLSILNVLVGLLSFWLLHTEGIFAAIYLILLFFGGMLIPLDLLPQWARAIGSFLPLEYAIYLPATHILNLSDSSFASVIGGQFLWIVILFAITLLLFKAGFKHYDAVGN